MEKSFSKQDTLAMKGIAILLMLAHHLFYATEQYVNYWIYYTENDEFNITVRIAMYAKMCVPMFVLLSGYGLTYAYERWLGKAKSKASFTLDRWLSVYGGFAVVFVLGITAGLFLGRDLPSIYGEKSGAWLFFLLDGLGLSSLFHAPTANATWWYMSFAFVQIFAFPLLYKLVKAYGAAALLLFLGMGYLGLGTYNVMLMSFAATGIYLAQANGFAKMRSWSPFSRGIWNKLLKLALYGIGFWVVFTLSETFPETFDNDGVLSGTHFKHWGYGLFGVVLMFFSHEFIFPVKLLRGLFAFLGTHSANIFLFHTFFYAHFFTDFYYEWEEPELIFAALLVTTLAASVVLELLKKLCRYDKGVARVRAWVDSRLNGGQGE